MFERSDRKHYFVLLLSLSQFSKKGRCYAYVHKVTVYSRVSNFEASEFFILWLRALRLYCQSTTKFIFAAYLSPNFMDYLNSKIEYILSPLFFLKSSALSLLTVSNGLSLILKNCELDYYLSIQSSLFVHSSWR